MTAGEIAAATGLARASVSSTLSQLAKAGELSKAARGYQIAGLEPAQRFYFRIEDDATPRAAVANLPELEAAIAVCGPGVLRHHCAEHDFSRWVAGVFHNEPLAADIVAADGRDHQRRTLAPQPLNSPRKTTDLGSRPQVCEIQRANR